jgi:hypothetical protein
MRPDRMAGLEIPLNFAARRSLINSASALLIGMDSQAKDIPIRLLPMKSAVVRAP